MVFVVGLVEYAQVMYEDNKVTRINESLALFKQWANHKSFSKAPIILALTKKDVFEETFSAELFKKTFPDFDGSTPVDGVKFIQGKFEDRLAKRDVNAPFKSFVLDTTSASESLELLNSIRQLVATHRSGFLMDAVKNAVELRKKSKGKRGSVMRRASAK